MIRHILILLITFSISHSILAQDAMEDIYSYNYASLTKRCGVYDPFEQFNRKVFLFNGVLDFLFLKPVSKIYDKLTTDYMKNRADSSLSNLSEPLTTLNYLIQGKLESVFKSFWRFTINSTLGILGLFDVASKVGLAEPQQTFGHTLAYYGAQPGPYIILPIYNSMSLRDIPNLFFAYLDPIKYLASSNIKTAKSIFKMVHGRNKIMSFTDNIAQSSTDPYITLRNAILSKREGEVTYPENFQCKPVYNN